MTDVSVSVTCSCSLIESCLIPLILATPPGTVQESLCVCARSHSWPPPVSLHQPQHLPPKQTLLSSPLPYHLTHSLLVFLCGDWYCNMLELIPFIFHTSSSAVNTFAGAICSPWKQIILLSSAWSHACIYLIVWNLKKIFDTLFSFDVLFIQTWCWIIVSVPKIIF